MVALVLAVVASACFFKPDPPDQMIITPPGYAQFAVGDHHACLIDANHHLWCWGDNRFGQLGPDTAEPYTGTPVQLMPASTWKTVAAGRAHTCAISTDNTIYCWGANNSKQVDAGSPTTKLGVVPVDLNDSSLTPEQIFAGADASCTITTDAQLLCWGAFKPPQTTGYGVTPVKPGGMLAEPPHQGWFDVAISDTHVCALNDFGDVACWGDDTRLQLGDPSTNNHDVDQAYVYTDKFKNIAVGSLGTCGVTLGNTFECFGHASITHSNDDNAQAVIDTRQDWKMIAVGEDHVCGVRGDDGEVFCYGGDALSQLGDDFSAAAQLPSSPLISRVTEIYASRGWTCARQIDGVHCWGSNQFGEAGNGKVATAHHPYQVLTGTAGELVSIATGTHHACVVRTSGEIDCWGSNQAHQIVGTTTPFYTTPMDTTYTAGTLSNLRPLSVGSDFACTLHAQDQLQCWGDGGGNPLAATTSATPFQLGIGSASAKFVDVGAGYDSTCVTVDDNSGWCWGALADTAGMAKKWESNVTRVAVGAGIAVFAGSEPSNAIYVDPTPQGCFTDPNPLGTYTGQIRKVTVSQLGDGHACAESNDNVSTSTLTCWGSNGHRQIEPTAATGDGCVAATDVMFPNGQKVKNWDSPFPNILSASGNHTCAIVEGPPQALYCWGDNTSEALGEANMGSEMVTIPTIATTDQSLSWWEVSTAPTYTCAITDAKDAVYCWGLNERGQVGNGDRFPSAPPTDPVAIPAM
jgi:alpha-tubulin suppressor-like RCC1 family protein